MVPGRMIRRNGYGKKTIQTGCGSLTIPFPKVRKGGSVFYETWSEVYTLWMGKGIPRAGDVSPQDG
ncbi:hypothetical protein [Pasteuria penetrans]|uniref:hypothetical protein n=1 Tax=Pasteuria penetrans TaxID=86005 RepID=UPI000FBC7609|nr:hypothetical protein [Pasteuria penetrans]